MTSITNAIKELQIGHEELKKSHEGESRLHATLETVATMQERVESLRGQQKSLQVEHKELKRSSGNEARLQAALETNATTQVHIEGLQGQHNALQDQQGGLQERQQSLKQRADANTPRVDALQRQQHELQRSASASAALQESVDGLQQQHHELRQRVETNMASKERVETLHQQQRELRQQMESSAAWREELCQTVKTIEQEVDHAKRAAQSPRFQAKMAELDDQVRCCNKGLGPWIVRPSLSLKGWNQTPSNPSSVRMSGSRVWRRPWRASSVSLRNWTMPCFVLRAGSTSEHRRALLTDKPRLADPVQDTLREDRLRQYAEQAKDSEARVQKALRDATAQVQEVRILRDSATTMVVDAKDHMQQQAAGIESSRMSVETARQEVVALKAALELDSRLVQRPEQRPVCAFREDEQSQLQSRDTTLADMGVTLRSLKEHWPGTQDRIEQQISAVSTRLETLMKGNADSHREIQILQGWSQEDEADRR